MLKQLIVDHCFKTVEFIPIMGKNKLASLLIKQISRIIAEIVQSRLIFWNHVATNEASIACDIPFHFVQRCPMSDRTVTDFRIYNDGNDVSLASRHVAESYSCDEMLQSTDLCRSLAQDGHYFSVDLPEDNSVSVRVLRGPMSQQEQEEWVGRISWKLDL